jgi:hypothetical protein
MRVLALSQDRAPDVLKVRLNLSQFFSRPLTPWK